MSEGRVERRLAAILAVDVAGYSRLMGADEEGTLAALKAIRRELGDPKIAEHRGRIVKTTGDGLLVEFASVVDAVRCAVEVQREMVARNAAASAERRIEFRMGINVGDIIIEDADIFGDGVNIAARLEALAAPGGICLSAAAHEQVRDRLDIAFDDLGEQQVKNIARPVRTYAVALGAPSRAALPVAAPLPLPDKPSLAVLPFQNMTGDAEQEYFVDGMVEEITTAIARLPWLFVIARNSAFTYKSKPVDVKQVGRELGVRYVLEGSVRKAGNRVRITSQLIDTAAAAHIWADRFDGALDDIFELQDQVASSVAGAIEPRLRQSETERSSRKPTDSLDAYDCYLRALGLRNNVYIEVDENVRSAIALLKKALAMDPNYAPAAASIGWCRGHQWINGRVPPAETEVAEAVALSRQVIETERNDPDALWMAGYTLFVFAGESGIAVAAADRALTLNCNSAHAWMMRGLATMFDAPEVAIEAFEHAIRLSPLDHQRRAFTFGISTAHLRARRYDEALDWAEQTLRIAPGYRLALRNKAVACAYLNRLAEARAAVDELVAFQPGQTIASFKVQWARMMSPEMIDDFVDGLRKAGMAEE
jgi:TolB-like protein/class 3 adenylate cyclase